MKTFFPLVLALILCAAPPGLRAQVRTDFDNDGVSDFLTVFSGSDLTWKAKGSSSGVEELDLHFGIPGDTPVPAHWISGEPTSLAYVRSSATADNLVWKILLGPVSIGEVRFGRPGDIVMSGADFDGDGIGDAAAVRVKRKQVRWEARLNLFGDSPVTKKFKLGKDGDRVFFMSPDGVADWVGSFGRAGKRKSRLLLRNVVTGAVQRHNGFPRTLSRGTRPRPFPIAGSDGIDLLGFVTSDESDTTLSVYNLAGEEVARHIFPGLGTMIVGDFSAATAGEEIIFQTASTMSRFNPLDADATTITYVSGQPIGGVTVAVVG